MLSLAKEKPIFGSYLSMLKRHSMALENSLDISMSNGERTSDQIFTVLVTVSLLPLIKLTG